MIIFTKQEKIVLIFLLASLFVGAALTMGTSLMRSSANRPVSIEPVPSDVTIDVPTRKIDINKASKVELIKLKHIGPVLAGRIISYREERGPFESAEDIKNVKGIGQRAYENLKKHIILE